MSWEDEMQIELRRIADEEARRVKATSWLMIGFAIVVLVLWVGGKGAAAGWSSAG